MFVSNITLVKIGAVFGVATVTMGYALRYKINSRIKETDYYQEAISLLKSHRGAKQFLGEPIKEGNIEVGDSINNFTNDYEAKYVVPVIGPNQKGTLYFWAHKKDKWYVNRVELGLENEPNRRLLIKSDNNLHNN